MEQLSSKKAICDTVVLPKFELPSLMLMDSVHNSSPLGWWTVYIITVPYVGGLGTELHNIILIHLEHNYSPRCWWTRYRIIVPGVGGLGAEL